VDWIVLAQDRDVGQTLVDMVMKFEFHKMREISCLLVELLDFQEGTDEQPYTSRKILQRQITSIQERMSWILYRSGIDNCRPQIHLLSYEFLSCLTLNTSRFHLKTLLFSAVLTYQFKKSSS
jgi:hypothetical protein